MNSYFLFIFGFIPVFCLLKITKLESENSFFISFITSNFLHKVRR
jgi:hypothetical protein